MSRLQVHHSHRIDDLAQALGGLLSTPTARPFQRDAVVIHSKGFERWLAMQVAQRTGICANVAFLFPSDLVAEALSAVLGPDHAVAWTTERITWAILAALPSLDDVPALQPVRDFIAAGGGVDEGRRRIEVAQQIARLFENYASWRPELAERWAGGGGTGWEPPLWRAVADRVAGQDLGALVRRFEGSVADADLSPLPARIAVFSVATLPPLVLRLIAALARHREVHLYLLGPSPAGWARTNRRSGPGTSALAGAAHPLLESMGTVAREFQRTILALEPDLVPAASSPPSAPPSTLLARLQADLRDGRIASEPHVLDPADRSVQVHACHGPLRQVQILRDALLGLFDALPDLEPRDVVVMTPEIEAYAPLIRAVFDDGAAWGKRDAHPGGLPRLSYRVADEGVRSSNPAADVLLALLHLSGGRLKATDVVDLLSHERVGARFGVGTDDLPRIKEWVAGSGIRWGADADHRTEIGQPATELYTWRLGLDRLLLGQSVAEQDALLFDVLPFGDVEGRDGRALLGGFVDFAEKVLATTQALQAPRSLSDWRTTLLRSLDDFVSSDGGAWQLEQVRQGLAELVDTARDAGFDGLLDRDAIDAILRGRFSISEPGRGFLTGGVTFCRLTPMRSIPFRVVCLLGMDDGAFPRTQGGLAFDRIEQDPRPGDRSAVGDDRALFLEALLSSSDGLVVTYSGRSPRSNRTQAPAVPVAELLDLIDQTVPGGADAVTTHHPLQPYSPRAFSSGQDGRLRSFDRRHLAASEAWRAARSAAAVRPSFVNSRAPSVLEDPQSSVAIDDLARFFKDPLAWYVERRLGLWSPDEAIDLENREPAEKPPALTAWALRNELLEDELAGLPTVRPSAAWDRLRRRAGLPLGMPGEVQYDALRGEACDIAERALELRKGPALDDLEVDLTLQGRGLVGRIGAFYPGGRVVARAGSAAEKYLIGLWVQHLAACASGFAGRSVLVGRRGQPGFEPVGPTEAREHLETLLGLFRQGACAPLLFFPTISYRCAETELAGEEIDPDKLWPPSDFDCRKRARLLADRNPFAPDFVDSVLQPDPDLGAVSIAHAVWAPAIEHLIEEAP